MSEHGNLNDYLFQRDFLQGYVNDYVSKGFKLAKFFTPQQTDADTFTKIKDEMTIDEAIESGRMHKPRPMVKNADIEMIADEFYETEIGYIRSIGYGIQVNEKLENTICQYCGSTVLVEDAIEKLTDKFESFLEKFSEFQGELKSNADFMANLESEFQKRNPTSVEKLTMRSLQSKPFQETPEEYMENDAPANYSPEDDNNGVGEPRYTITRDDVRNATDYSSIAKTLRDNGNSTLKTLLGL